MVGIRAPGQRRIIPLQTFASAFYAHYHDPGAENSHRATGGVVPTQLPARGGGEGAGLLMDEDGGIGVDFIGRYEDMQESFAEVCRRIGIPPGRGSPSSTPPPTGRTTTITMTSCAAW